MWWIMYNPMLCLNCCKNSITRKIMLLEIAEHNNACRIFGHQSEGCSLLKELVIGIDFLEMSFDSKNHLDCAQRT